MDAVRRHCDALLAAGSARCEGVGALELDETLSVRRGEKHLTSWATLVVDVGGGRDARLVEVVEGRTAKNVPAWIDKQPQAWTNEIRLGTLGMSDPQCKAFNDSLPAATQVADPIPVIKHANSKADL